MAAPEDTNILNMTGIWSLNSAESDDLDATFAVQGIPWIIRKVIAYARLEIEMKQQVSDEPDTKSATIINVKQTVRPGGFDTANRYILDGQTRHDTVPIFGAMSMKASYVSRAEVSEEATLGREIEDPVGGDGRVAIEERSGGVNTGWQTVATWGFEEVNGERRFCKYCITTKGDQKAEARLVYDYRALSA
ncbi:hypothetical protein INS49_005353 [Diaporthe citri]|uniref:uncharacterized protein n=1 Tax=Diaporthe citri TaxID=83186 RepID=UPI001C82193D|nr:uncharacterized protein INS49_005353 [Diaporthe citri]KAG6353645.1 hypothetical protein INS49_005353 [Diaporthe citri]